ncbi:CehA/McbA family metallohydrolase domain-containing protein [Limnochorda pilosa]|uniref:Polymerase/histidinol phosphatase N-terminal domain-containing protein n=1 Tax=Limnochorda pilosa TaxID=1555112 RepID=A0A0K2SL60_LIMPI|nr:PHP-associated domain-containing protein [Limnochorda pilosa]BAS27732.1 hypothetical protein LIP_1891 [Limnochorda pilosa]
MTDRESGTNLGPFLADPHAGPGLDRKAQLHVHTARSRDARTPALEMLAAYRSQGFSFVVITDHDRPGLPPGLPPGPDGGHLAGECLVLPGEEATIPNPFWPLGPHLLRILATRPLRRRRLRRRDARRDLEQALAATAAEGGLCGLAHPGWRGNLETGLWRPEVVDGLPGIRLIEVWNPHSDTGKDEAFWHREALLRGPEAPVWASAGDDSHEPGHVGRAWLAVKTPEVSVGAFREALLAGRFYPTTGAEAAFAVADGSLRVETSPEATIRFVAGQGGVVAEAKGPVAFYRPAGSERFVRVVVEDAAGKAWSQPFWLR